MPLSHLLLGLSVVVVWGTNFVVIKWGLGDFPPFLFAALRFIFSALPWVFFVRRPAVSWKRLAAAGIFTGVGQFDLLFWAMQHGSLLAAFLQRLQTLHDAVLPVGIGNRRAIGHGATALVFGHALRSWASRRSA